MESLQILSLIRHRQLILLSIFLLIPAGVSIAQESLLEDKLPLDPVAVIADENKQEHASQFTDLGLNAGAESKKQPTVEMYPGTGGFLIGQPNTGIPIKPPGAGEYTLNFDDADLGEVVKVILSDTLGENYMFSPKVSGRVTLQTTRALSRDELIPTLEILLRMNGAVLIQGKGGFRIEPTEQALTGVQSVKLGRLGQRVPTGYQLRVIPLRYIGVEEMQKILEPILPEKSVVRIDKTRNLMVLAGTGSELQNILETINVFDVNLLKDMSVMIYPLQNVNAKTIIGELEQVFGHGPDEDNPLRGMFKVIPIERMNSVMVITPQPQYLKEARTWLERLDRSTADTGGSGGIYVYRVQNVTATTLADLLNALFSTGGKKAPPPAQLSPGRSAVSIGNMASAVAGAAGGTIKSSARQLSVGGHQNVQVTADENNNSLVIVATAQAYKTLMDVITKLDISPLQVLINATIVEVDLKDSLEHGIQWFFKHAFGPYSATTTNKFNTGNANTTSGIPFLKDIPYLGWLFSTQTRAITQTELVVLITPQVIEDRGDTSLITDEFKRKLTGIFEELEDEKQNDGDQLAGKLSLPWDTEETDVDIGETEKTSSSNEEDLLNEFDMDLEGSDEDLFGELDEFASDTEGPTLLSAANGFNYSVVDSASAVRALLAVLAKQDNINVVSSPALVALNNQEATISVGDKVPIANSTPTTTSGSGDDSTEPIVTNQIQMVDTGVMLKLKPRVNANGMVILNFELENNEAIKTTTSGLDSPTIQQRKIKSTIAVQSGNTIVLGGLIKDKREGPEPGEAELVTQLITNLSGKARKRYSHFWVKPRGRKGLDVNPNIINVKLDFETWTGRDYWRLDFAGWAEAGNALERYRGISQWLQDRKRYSRHFEANQLYFTLSQDDFDVTLGKKVFNNGLSSLFSPADRMKPADTNDPTDPRILGIWQAVMDYYWKDFSFTGAIFPVYQALKVPGGPSRWLGSDDDFSGGDFQFSDNDSTTAFDEGIPPFAHGTKNFSYFLRTKASLAGYDFFLSSFYGMNPYWVLRETGDDQEYTKEVVKVGNLAAGVSTTWKAWQFHGEAVYSHSFDGKDDNYLNYVVGATYVLDDFAKRIGLDGANVTFEYAGEWVHAHQSAESYVASSRTSRVGRNDIFTLVNLTHGDFSVIYANNMEFIYDGSYNKIELQYRMGDGLRSSFALEFFEGSDEGGYYGRFRRNHRGIIELEYLF